VACAVAVFLSITAYAVHFIPVPVPRPCEKKSLLMQPSVYMQRGITAEPPAAAAADEPPVSLEPPTAEYVCAVARVPLLQLARGLTRLTIDAPLQPLSTMRGMAGLDWRSRPGEYMHAQSRLVGSIRCAGQSRATCSIHGTSITPPIIILHANPFSQPYTAKQTHVQAQGLFFRLSL
jgi:hypothetical protein